MTETQFREAVADCVARLKETLERLKARGIALDVARPIRHSFRAPTAEAAEQLAIGLKYRGIRVVEGPAAAGPHFALKAEIFCPPSLAADEPQVEILVRLATIHESEYVGWEAGD